PAPPSRSGRARGRPRAPARRPPLLEPTPRTDVWGSLPPARDRLNNHPGPGLVSPRPDRVGPRPTPEGRQDAAREPAVVGPAPPPEGSQDAARSPAVDHHLRAAGAVPVQPPSRPPVVVPAASG